jgi:hypothetical protein
MQAYKIDVTISEQRTVQLPDHVPAGPPEVIVLVPARRPAPLAEATEAVQRARAEDVRRYVEGYARTPETGDEIAAAEAAAAQLLAEEPWE